MLSASDELKKGAVWNLRISHSFFFVFIVIYAKLSHKESEIKKQGWCWICLEKPENVYTTKLSLKNITRNRVCCLWI